MLKSKRVRSRSFCKVEVYSKSGKVFESKQLSYDDAFKLWSKVINQAEYGSDLKQLVRYSRGKAGVGIVAQSVQF